ncbi:MAG: hypothetical protein QN229_06095 [Desulfurococcaceae archaeon TW002]
MKKNVAKILMSMEAFFGGLYVAVTRGLFVPMLTYSGYTLNTLSQITFFAALMNVILSYLIYNYPSLLAKNVKMKLLIVHGLERLLFALLPFLIGIPDLLIIVYGIALTVTIPVGVLLNVALLNVFVQEEFVEISILRAALGAASSLLGSIYTIFVTAFIEAPASYYVAYISSSVVGLFATAALIYYDVPKEFGEPGRTVEIEEVKIRKVNTFLMLILMMSGGNLIGLAWPQLLKTMNSPLYVTMALNLAGNFGGIVGPYLWRGYRAYVLAIAINIAFTSVIPFLVNPLTHVLVSAVLSATFIGANLIASAIYSKYVESLGIIKASTFLTSSSAVGLLIASVLGRYLPDAPLLVFGLATLLKLLALFVCVLAIPETAVVPPRTAYGYGKLIYLISIIGYTFTVETSKRVFKLFIQLVALTLLLTLILLLYELIMMLSTV